MSDMEQHFRELDEIGYTVMEDVLTPGQIEEAIAALKESYVEEHVSAHEPGTCRTHNLTARAEIFREIIQLPRVVACMEYLLGEDYILSDMGARSPMPGKEPQGLHRDGGPFVPNPPYNVHTVVPIVAQSMFALSEFTEENGATRLVPGSHIENIEAADVTPEQERYFIAAPGTVLVYDGRMLHGGGRNSSDELRYSIQGFCCRGNMRPFCDHTRSTPLEVVEKATPLLRRLLGFTSQSAWEETPRNFKIIEAPDAAPRFNYNLGIDD